MCETCVWRDFCDPIDDCEDCACWTDENMYDEEEG